MKRIQCDFHKGQLAHAMLLCCMIFPGCSLVLSTSASDWLERLVSETGVVPRGRDRGAAAPSEISAPPPCGPLPKKSSR